MAGACEWPVIWPEACRELDPVRAGRTAAMLGMATDLLWNWTGRRFGVCPVTVEFEHDPGVCGCELVAARGGGTFTGRGLGVSGPGLRGGSAPWTPVLLAGVVKNLSCGCYQDPCVCRRGPAAGAVRLPGPVASVSGVTVDGDPEGGWSLLPGGWLARAGGAAWPHAGLRVSYERGTPVPVGGRVALGVLAWELSKAVECPEDCQLPQRVTAVTRQGVSVAVMDQFADLGEGRTGIWLIDSWVSSVMMASAGAGTVVSPDTWCRGEGGAAGWRWWSVVA